MNMRHALAGLLLVLSAPALGASPFHCPYARWGMTPDELIRTADGRAVRATPPPGGAPDRPRELIDAPFESGRFRFEAGFLFGAHDRLSGIDLLMADPQRCLDLADFLITSFGEPVRENDRAAEIQTFRWTDKPAKERLVLSRRGTKKTEGCTLEIRPEPEPSARPKP